MPSVSEAQRRYLFAKFGAAWVKGHHFDNKGKLPAKVSPVTNALKKHRKHRRHR